MYLLEGMLVGGDDISHKHNAANGVQATINPEKSQTLIKCFQKPGLGWFCEI